MPPKYKKTIFRWKKHTDVDIGHIALIFGSNFFNILLPAPPTFQKFKRLFDIGLIDGENGPKKL